MRLQDFDTSKKYVATVLQNERITPQTSLEDVRDIGLVVEKGEFHARVGQNIGVVTAGRSDMGEDQHFRLYSIADVPRMSEQGQHFSICVRRCSYVDEFSGEKVDGVASNYLCDSRVGQRLSVTGPYGQAFRVPADRHANLILISAGTGIAPFRAFVKHIYHHVPEFDGRIWLFHGAQTGIDLLYRNDQKDDFALYYDRDTFEAINALSARPGWSAEIDWGAALHSRGEELCNLLSSPTTHVYVAGLQSIRDELDDVLADIAGSNQTWFRWKAELEADHRWTELTY